MKGKVAGSKEAWMTQEIKAMVRKKEAWARHRQLGSSVSLQEFRGSKEYTYKINQEGR